MLRSRAQVAYAVTRQVERVYTFGVNACKFLKGQRRCHTREGRVSTPGKIKSGNPISMQLTRKRAQRICQRLQLSSQQLRNHGDLFAHQIQRATDAAICSLNLRQLCRCGKEMHGGGSDTNAFLHCGGIDVSQLRSEEHTSELQSRQ